ncbi:hypothetical protein [Solemya elarraichensis gill symbiont]|uniref:Bacterial toxin 8 domain-containing protein n=1 Tax=Solemya elarraichensis gill symbiont TaxID=1918949 RepID=A0A1T2KXG9_9GAMM|nr:hypothetical protein [Solemya elarraichensis gill symbiont]OOZ37504.1 hypothetical protein BOW52_10180 [Solemya elarraichensis gill symbiont]
MLMLALLFLTGDAYATARMLKEVSTEDNSPFFTGKSHDDVTGLSYFPDGREPHRWADGNYSDNDGQAIPGRWVQIKRVYGKAGEGIAEHWDKSAVAVLGILGRFVLKGTAKSAGRSGKQARLREMMNDPKVSSADRGWLKNDARHIEYGNKSGLRVPRNGRKSPGRKAQDKGYELAHPYNAPASQGNSYAGSKLKNHADHKVETRLHRHRY